MIRKTLIILKCHWKLILAVCMLIALGLVAARLIYLHWFGYIVWLPFTGLEDKDLWDLAELLIIPVTLAGVAAVLDKLERQTDREIAKERAKVDSEIAIDNQREAALQNYFDAITELIFDRNLRNSSEEDEVREIAQVKTTTTLDRLDTGRKAKLIRFLCGVGLVNNEDNYEPIICLNDVNLNETSLTMVNLRNANLGNANLSRANLVETNLEGTDLTCANLEDAILIGAQMAGAKLRNIKLNGANLACVEITSTIMVGIDLHCVEMSLANLSNSNLCKADLCQTDLSWAELEKVNLTDAKLTDAYLINTNLTGANLQNSNMTGAILTGTNLKDANLKNANLSFAHLEGATKVLTHLKQIKPELVNMLRIFPDGPYYKGANLIGANLNDVIVTGATYDEETLWPAGFDPVAAGAVNIDKA